MDSKMHQQAVISVVDDDKPTRDVICEMVDAMGYKVNQFISGDEFLQKYTKSQLECLVLDIRMPGISGMELLAKLTEDDIYIPTIIITGHGDIPMALEAIDKGAVDFLEKPFREQALLESITKALDTCNAERLKRQGRNDLQETLSSLTDRDTDVLKQLIIGYSDKQIAHKLDISRRTVALHRANILEKSGFSSVVNLATSITRYNISL
jgi:FixJ family two-component response regulator